MRLLRSEAFWLAVILALAVLELVLFGSADSSCATGSYLEPDVGCVAK